MTKHYCNIHGEYGGGWVIEDGCPQCKEAESRETSANEELSENLQEMNENIAAYASAALAHAEAAREAAHRNNNPGEYECSACKMTSLKRSATRCPVCRTDVPPDFWKKIFAQEQQAADTRKQAEIKHRDWLASSEGIARTRRQSINEEINSIENKRKEWNGAWREVMGVGIVLSTVLWVVLWVVISFTKFGNMGTNPDVFHVHGMTFSVFWKVIAIPPLILLATLNLVYQFKMHQLRKQILELNIPSRESRSN